MGESLANRIKRSRKILGITQGELGKRVGVSDVTILRWERGERVPNASFLPKLAKELNVSVEYLMGVENTTDEGEVAQTNLREDKEDNFTYWGNMLDRTKRIANRGDIGEISLIETFLKSAYEMLAVRKAQVAHAGTIPEKSINFDMRHNYMNGATFDA